MILECLKHPISNLALFFQNKILNALKINNVAMLPHHTMNLTLWVSDRETIWEIRLLHVQELKL